MPLQVAVLEKIRSLYPIAQEASFLESVTEGFLSRNVILQTPKLKLFLKEYGSPERNTVEEIHKAKIFFATRGIPAILPYVNEEQTTIFTHQDRQYALFPFVEGRIIRRSERTPKAHSSAGSMLARIHLAGREDHSDIDVPEQKSWDQEEFLEKAATIEECISRLPELSEYDLLALRSIEFKQGLARVNPITPDMLGIKNDHLIHGDYHGRNIFYNADDEVSHVFDFEKTCRAPRAFEIARALDFMCFAPHYHEEGFAFAQYFLRAYNEVYPLPKDELVQGIMKFYLRSVHSLWPMTEHYLLQNTRTDSLLESQTLRVEYYSKHLESHLERITSVY